MPFENGINELCCCNGYIPGCTQTHRRKSRMGNCETKDPSPPSFEPSQIDHYFWYFMKMHLPLSQTLTEWIFYFYFWFIFFEIMMQTYNLRTLTYAHQHMRWRFSIRVHRKTHVWKQFQFNGFTFRCMHACFSFTVSGSSICFHVYFLQLKIIE